jgi:gamma-glutamyltranspeptidase/glutathione hydrolase/leukotriene-C4 hydrolase
VREAGGIFAESDLHSYFAERMASQRTRFRGADVLGARLPSGSAVLATMLNIYDLYPASANASDPLATHRMIEAMKFAFADRGQLGDPGFANLKGVYPEMIEDAHAFACRSRINDSRTFEPSYYNLLWGRRPTTRHQPPVGDRPVRLGCRAHDDRQSAVWFNDDLAAHRRAAQRPDGRL